MPMVSVVVVVHNIPREAPRTLFSLSAEYQRHIRADEYEVIVVDNGSDPPFDPRLFDQLRGNFRLIRMDPAPPSPAAAINRGLREAKGELIGIMVDGARLVTPGLLHFARVGASLYPRAIVASLGWYLGYDLQRASIEAGYDQAQEDELLRSIDWPQDGYRLFDISTLDESSVDGWLSLINESNALFLSRDFWNSMKGVDEAFDAPGGGLLNLDTLRRAMDVPDSELVLLLGEATFHQLHGGIATNASPEKLIERLGVWLRQYAELRGQEFSIPPKQPTYLGTLPRPALLRFIGAIVHPLKQGFSLGHDFDRRFWSLEPPKLPSDPTALSLVTIAHEEFEAGNYAATAGVARLARRHFPDEPEPQRLVALIGPALTERVPQTGRPAFHAAVGRAYMALGDPERARAEFEAALALQPDMPVAHIGLSTLNLPGPRHFDWISVFHDLLTPKFYVEIGVNTGLSICRAMPPTCAIGVDPLPQIQVPFRTETHIFAETSDEFFARQRLPGLLGGQKVGFGFIDGLHLFEQSLLDFINLEAFCGPDSVILFHDTCPLDEATQAREQRTSFHSGDIWKTVLCLKDFRPDLDIFTIAAPWTGLTVVTGLDPHSTILREHYQGIVEEYRDTPYSTIKDNKQRALNMVENSFPLVKERVRSRLNLKI